MDDGKEKSHDQVSEHLFCQYELLRTMMELLLLLKEVISISVI